MKEDDLTLGGSLILSQTKFERGIPGFSESFPSEDVLDGARRS